MMASFDATPFSESCERRSSTTTPLQALGMMNGTLVQEEADHLATRIRKDVGEERSLRFRMLLRSCWDAHLRLANCASFRSLRDRWPPSVSCC